MVVLAGQDDNLGIGGYSQYLLEQAEALRNRIGIGWQAKIHGYDWRVMAMDLCQRTFPISSGQGFVLVERPAKLFLQRQVVFYDKKGARPFGCHALILSLRSDSVRITNNGRETVIRVP